MELSILKGHISLNPTITHKKQTIHLGALWKSSLKAITARIIQLAFTPIDSTFTKISCIYITSFYKQFRFFNLFQ